MQTAIGKAMAAAKGPLHMVRGSGDQEKMLKNAKTEYFNEHEEIATYLAIETLAERVGDRETAKLAKGIRREEERMAKFLEGQIRALSGTVAGEEVPAAQRKAAGGSRKRSSAKSKRPAAKKKSITKRHPARKKSSASKPAAKAKRARTSARASRR
jgi:rubrerythrin